MRSISHGFIVVLSSLSIDLVITHEDASAPGKPHESEAKWWPGYGARYVYGGGWGMTQGICSPWFGNYWVGGCYGYGLYTGVSRPSWFKSVDTMQHSSDENTDGHRRFRRWSEDVQASPGAASTEHEPKNTTATALANHKIISSTDAPQKLASSGSAHSESVATRSDGNDHGGASIAISLGQPASFNTTSTTTASDPKSLPPPARSSPNLTVAATDPKAGPGPLNVTVNATTPTLKGAQVALTNVARQSTAYCKNSEGHAETFTPSHCKKAALKLATDKVSYATCGDCALSIVGPVGPLTVDEL